MDEETRDIPINSGEVELIVAALRFHSYDIQRGVLAGQDSQMSAVLLGLANQVEDRFLAAATYQLHEILMGDG